MILILKSGITHDELWQYGDIHVFTNFSEKQPVSIGAQWNNRSVIGQYSFEIHEEQEWNASKLPSWYKKDKE